MQSIISGVNKGKNAILFPTTIIDKSSLNKKLKSVKEKLIKTSLKNMLTPPITSVRYKG